MEEVITVEFYQAPAPHVAMEAVVKYGACAIHNFVSYDRLMAAAELLRREQNMTLDENLTDPVHRRQHMRRFVIGADTPDTLKSLVDDMQQYAHDGGVDWTPNEIIAHRYESNDFIDRHRDHSEAHGLIGVLTLDGMQDFYVELDGAKDPAKVTMRPGTLTVLRGFTSDTTKRPYHWVGRPATQRTALSVREMCHRWSARPGDWA